MKQYSKYSNYSKILIFIIVIGIFTKEQFTIYLNDFGFDFIGYLSCIFIFIFFQKKILNNKSFNNIFLYILVTGLISTTFFDLTIFNFLKSLIPITIVYYTNFWVIKNNKLDKIFNLYIQIAFYSAILGLLQYVL